MKKFVLFIFAIFICTVAFAQTINWHVGNSVYTTTTCSAGDSVTPPTPPVKYGYTFVRWGHLYTQIEYLESTGTQWIDTGYVPNQDTRVMLSYIKPSSSPSATIFGARSQQNIDAFAFIYTSQNTVRTDYNNQLFAWPITYIFLDSRLIVDKNKNETIIKDLQNNVVCEHTFQQSNFSTNFNLYIFTMNDAGNIGSKSGAKIYYLKIYDNDTLVRDFIPVLDANGVPCMFDKVSRTFFYNAGTGDFIAGPMISE